MDGMIMIDIQSLLFHYPAGEFRLEIPAFTVARGEKTAVIGPSGSGKTTLLNLIAGIVMPVKGALNVGNTNVNELGDAQRRAFRISNIGFVFQDFELLDYLNVMDNIQSILDAVISVVAIATILANFLVFALSLRLRQGEIKTIFKLGCGRTAIASLVGAEIGIILLISGVFCAAGVYSVHRFSDELVRMLFIGA